MQNHDNYSDQQGFICPSFNTYSSPSAADTASRVCREFKSLGLLDEDTEYEYEYDHDDDEDDDFEFVSFQESGERLFLGDNAIMGPVFPVFNRDLISQRDLNDAVSTSSASSDVDELEGVPAGSYCVWMPKTTPTSSPSHCKKSKSTGSTYSSSSLCRKFRLRDFLKRSNSEGGKDVFVLLTPELTSSTSAQKKLVHGNNSNINNNDHENRGHEKIVVSTKGKESIEGRRRSANGRSAVSMAHEVFYAGKSKENNKRQSFLPYRKDLVGFFASVNAMGRTFPAF